jgi:hypothetical protein
MKKTAFSLSLLFSLLAGCVVGCDVKKKKDDGKQVLFTVDGTNVCADDLLGFDSNSKMSYDFLSTDEGVEAVYEAVYKALAQRNVDVTSAIEGAVDEKMDEWDDSVESYASANGVTKTNAKKTKLEELGFEDEDELRFSYLVEELKEELTDLYKDSHMEPTNVTNMDGKSMLERYVKETSPMVVKHILSNVADSATIYNMAAISESEVNKLVSIMQRLSLAKLTRNSFKNIAYEESDDGSSTKGGNLGIVDTYTSFVPEFKLGLYVAEVIENHSNADYNGLAKFGMSDYEDELFGANGIYANYEVPTINVATLGAVLAYVYEDNAADEQKAAGHTKTSEYESDLYPRNIIYNHYLNCPGIQYLKVDTTSAEAEILALLAEVYPHADNTTLATKAAEVMGGSYFLSLTEAENLQLNSDKVVVDDDNAPIIVAKSTYGFHFISATYSSLDKEPAEAVKYFMYGNNAPEGTYVKSSAYDFGYSTTTVAQNTRKSEIEGRVLNYIKGGFESISTEDKLYEYEIFNYYLGLGTVTFANDTLKNAVSDKITVTSNLKANAISEAKTEEWSNYIEKVQATEEARKLFY